MIGTRRHAAWLGLLLLCTPQAAPAQQPASRPPVWPTPVASPIRPAPVASEVPLFEVPDRSREQVRSVIEQPTVSGIGPTEEFAGKIGMYLWLLDHPDRTSRAWRQMGAMCLDIVNRGDGRFGWTDPHGSDLSWETVYRGPNKHIWYAQGTVHPGPLFPTVPVRAVVVMHYGDEVGSQGASIIQHHADLFMQTDSKAAAMMVKLFGPSVPHVTEQCLSQLEMFFSALTNYIQRHPERAEALLR
jgi:hypothetical protein